MDYKSSRRLRHAISNVGIATLTPLLAISVLQPSSFLQPSITIFPKFAIMAAIMSACISGAFVFFKEIGKD